ncbi:MAG: hypothetical protein Q7U75_17685 [Desulfobacterales bacterium]|nr:hypothetical protein [Desulfobacterales bacterium]
MKPLASENKSHEMGCGQDLSIRALAENLKSVVGFDGDFAWDPAQPDGTPRKVLDVSRLKALGWEPAIDFDRGIASTYDWYLRKTTSAGGFSAGYS